MWIGDFGDNEFSLVKKRTDHTNPSSSQRKRSKIFSATLAFSPVHANPLIRILCDAFSPIVQRQKMLMEATVYDALFGTVFTYLSTLETERFQNAPLLNPFSKASVFISVFSRFSVDDRRKRIKICVYIPERISVFGALVLLSSVVLHHFRTCLSIALIISRHARTQ